MSLQSILEDHVRTMGGITAHSIEHARKVSEAQVSAIERDLRPEMQIAKLVVTSKEEPTT